MEESTYQFQVFYPGETSHIDKYVKLQGKSVCRNKISQEWINKSLEDYTFGVALIYPRARVGIASSKSAQPKAKRKDDDYYLKAFILARRTSDEVWITLVYSKDPGDVGKALIKEVELYSKAFPEVRYISLYSLMDEKLQRWYESQGYEKRYLFMGDRTPEGILMRKPL